VIDNTLQLQHFSSSCLPVKYQTHKRVQAWFKIVFLTDINAIRFINAIMQRSVDAGQVIPGLESRTRTSKIYKFKPMLSVLLQKMTGVFTVR
jgi:hypothetical protein